jgi:hypothetical protein
MWSRKTLEDVEGIREEKYFGSQNFRRMSVKIEQMNPVHVSGNHILASVWSRLIISLAVLRGLAVQSTSEIAWSSLHG